MGFHGCELFHVICEFKCELCAFVGYNIGTFPKLQKVNVLFL